MYDSLRNSGKLDELLSRGIEYIFISNIDNLGATLDPHLLGNFISSGKDVMVEVTTKTNVDVIGGTFIQIPRTGGDENFFFSLVEHRQVPPAYLDDFKSLRTFRLFNTNNIYVSLPFLKKQLESEKFQLTVLTRKLTISGQPIIQLETGCGDIVSITSPSRVEFVTVPRLRFLPVKTCSDLMLLQSDYFIEEHGSLKVNKRSPSSELSLSLSSSPSSSSLSSYSSTYSSSPAVDAPLPVISLGPYLTKITDYYSRIPVLPSLVDLNSLTIAGDVSIGTDVVLRGQVVIVAQDNERLAIPAGSILENCTVQGALEIVGRS